MDWNQITHLPALWVPFRHLPFALVAVVAVPSLLAFIVGAAMFKRRVGGVYFAVITQALALILSLGIDGNQGLTGGRNGITDLRTLLGLGHPHAASPSTFSISSARLLLIGCILLIARYVLSTRMGRLFSPCKDREDRVRFSGYDVASFKVFAFCLSAALSRHGRRAFRPSGRLYLTFARRHCALDRDGHLRRGRRERCRCWGPSMARCW